MQYCKLPMNHNLVLQLDPHSVAVCAVQRASHPDAIPRVHVQSNDLLTLLWGRCFASLYCVQPGGTIFIQSGRCTLLPRLLDGYELRRQGAQALTRAQLSAQHGHVVTQQICLECLLC